MAEKKNKPVTLVKNGRKVTLSLPREIVQYRAAGWREEAAQKAAQVPEADSPQDVAEPKSSEDPAVGVNPRPAAAQTAKGGAKK